MSNTPLNKEQLKKLDDALHSHANWAHQWPEFKSGTFIYGNGKKTDTVDTKAVIEEIVDAAVREAQRPYIEKIAKLDKLVKRYSLVKFVRAYNEAVRRGWQDVRFPIVRDAQLWNEDSLQFQPNTKELLGMEAKTDDKLSENGIRFDHPDGRSEGFVLGNVKEGE